MLFFTFRIGSSIVLHMYPINRVKRMPRAKARSLTHGELVRKLKSPINLAAGPLIDQDNTE
jgi:hypothetical protein